MLVHGKLKVKMFDQEEFQGRRAQEQGGANAENYLADGPVSRILCVPASRDAVIIPLGRASLRASSSLPEGPNEPGRLSPPIWPCSTRGFPCLGCRHPSGGLLPHLFTLALRDELVEDRPKVLPPARHRSSPHRRSILCGTFRSRALADPTPWCYQARCPAESGLSSNPAALRPPSQRSPGPPAVSIIAEFARGA